jgi:type I restriction enzyme M protein
MARSTVHYADKDTNNILKKLHNKLRPAGTPVQRVEYIIELLLLRIFEVKLVQDPGFHPLRAAFTGRNEGLLFSTLLALPNDAILPALNSRLFPFYARILSEARKVWPGNLSTKVQDQLVLIEEVFGNSNFTNNVTSGNLGEIIGLVADLDQDRLLQTDLLGDAIESALSETGGTKDIGLHRTPDHIRQFMVGLAAPTFQSRLFDPTVGTGGFMFDSFEYVLEGVTREGRWPGPKAHPELAAWFKAWFDRHPVEMPSTEVSTDFYRTGVGGVEYLGMVRKMAAINFYVRGLNPGNIQQGDALEQFGSAILPNSKTIVIANPPFGAQRDQASYPNVWSEYPTESETTILFVKLMLETLKYGGVCAVIVSEGFLTWDQNSARALRRALLEGCDLQAIISLPQGVFVSKGGQGPKTSILLFVKGRPTERVWFYKVTNDGYSMGTNRKPLPGCQLVEALDLFHTYVRQGLEPPESRHSFCIPAEWIKTLDPRVKDRIRTETRTDMAVKRAEDLARLEQKWAAQIAAKRLTEAGRLQRFAQHADLWEAKTQNEIARKIERAHLYSFNLSNYRSGLTLEQLTAWRDFAASRVREAEPEDGLERRYRAVAAAPIERLDELLSTLDPRHTLELDWARQFLAGVSPEHFDRYPHLGTLQAIIASQQRTPQVALKELLEQVSRPVVLEAGRTYRRVTVKLNGKGVVLRDRVTVDEVKGEKWFQVKEGDLIFSKIDARNGAFGLIHAGLDDGIVSNEFPTFTINTAEYHPVLLSSLLTTDNFVGQIEAKVSGASGRRRMEPEQVLDMLIPLPSLEEQQDAATNLAQHYSVISGATLIESNSKLDRNYFSGSEQSLREIAEIGTGSTPSRTNLTYFGGDIHWVLTAEVDECDIEQTAETLTEVALRDYSLRIYPPDTILVAMYGQGATRGKAAYLRVPAAITQNCAGIVIARPDILPRYVYYYLRSMYEAIRRQEYSGGGVPHLNLSVIANLRIPIPGLEEQQAVITELDRQMKLLADLRVLKAETEAKARKILDQIWES